MSKSKTKDYDYLFLSAMLSAREAKMLTRDRISRMIDASSFSDAAKMLTDCGYEDMSGMNAAEVEKALSAHRAAVFAELARMLPEPEILDAFRLKYDYHNAKVLIKAESANVDGAYLMSSSGRVPAQVLAESYHTEEYRYLQKTLAEAMTEARSIIKRTENPQLADFVLDRAYFSELTAMAQGLSSSYLLEYAKLSIDGANLSAIVRTLRMGRDFDFIKNALVSGGNINAARVAQSALSGESLEALYAGSEYQYAAQLGEAAAKGGSLTEFELSCDAVVSKFFDSARFVSFGVAPVVAYLAALENEITAARMILTGKLSGVNPAIIRERLCDINA